MGNRIQDAFDTIKADSSLKESTKFFWQKDVEKIAARFNPGHFTEHLPQFVQYCF